MISFVIPAHNEQEHLPATLRQLRRATDQLRLPHEVIVVNDDSTDRTAHIAIDAGARVIGVKHRQISRVRNAGAAAARFDRLCFLDADTHLPAATLAAAIRAMDQGSIAGGALVRFDEPVPLMAELGLMFWNCIARSFRWAAGCFVFMQRSAFDASGGFSDQLFAAEEIALSNRLKRLGPFTVLPHYVTTSARKLHSHSPFDHMVILLKMILTGGRNLRHRQGLDLWYSPQRDQKEETAEARRTQSSQR
jgi:glycosyltransferase involved in cell wall biosynthesis